jgi:hypothetical protein
MDIENAEGSLINKYKKEKNVRITENEANKRIKRKYCLGILARNGPALLIKDSLNSIDATMNRY